MRIDVSFKPQRIVPHTPNGQAFVNQLLEDGYSADQHGHVIVPGPEMLTLHDLACFKGLAVDPPDYNPTHSVL